MMRGPALPTIEGRQIHAPNDAEVGEELRRALEGTPRDNRGRTGVGFVFADVNVDEYAPVEEDGFVDTHFPVSPFRW